jgi:iron-sulfur cluster repair protein YtfE (RIC family)
MPTHERSASEKGSSHGKMAENVFEMLKQDHEKARNLFEKLEKSGRKDVAMLQKLFAQLQEELEIHMEGEERFLYTALEKYEEPREKVLESYEEHQVAKTLIGTFKSLAVDDERWGAKVSVLHEVVEHHMQEEERELFKVAKKVLAKGQIEEISLMFQQHKKEGRRPSRGAPVEG